MAAQWGSCVVDEVAQITCLVPLFQNAVLGLIALSGIALLLMMFVGGFGFLFSAGDPKKLEAARGTLTNAIMGVVVLVVAYLILLTIKTFTGVDVTKFQISI